jgi:hypothetical protein
MERIKTTEGCVTDKRRLDYFFRSIEKLVIPKGISTLEDRLSRNSPIGQEAGSFSVSS